MSAELQMITFAIALDTLGILTFKKYLGRLAPDTRRKLKEVALSGHRVGARAKNGHHPVVMAANKGRTKSGELPSALGGRSHCV